MSTITPSTAYGTTDTADTGDLSASELYDALEDWQLRLSIDGRGRNEASAHFRAIAKPVIRRIRQELRDRCLPMERPAWLQDAESALADAQDERETQAAALDMAVQ